MKLVKLVKCIVFTLPLVVLTGCPSTSNEDEYGSVNDGSLGGATYPLNGSGGLLGGNAGGDGSLLSNIEALKQANIIYFDFDRYDINSEYEQLLNSHAGYLRNNPGNKIVVEGHADERGTSEYNIALGERRANAVQMYLQGKGVSSSQLAIVSYGKEKPAVLGHDEAAHAKNRRAILAY